MICSAWPCEWLRVKVGEHPVPLQAMAYPLFFGFVETDTDLARRVVAAVSRGYQEVLQPLRPLLSGAAAALAGGGAGKVEL